MSRVVPAQCGDGSIVSYPRLCLYSRAFPAQCGDGFIVSYPRLCLYSLSATSDGACTASRLRLWPCRLGYMHFQHCAAIQKNKNNGTIIILTFISNQGEPHAHNQSQMYHTSNEWRGRGVVYVSSRRRLSVVEASTIYRLCVVWVFGCRLSLVSTSSIYRLCVVQPSPVPSSPLPPYPLLLTSPASPPAD